MFFQVSSLSLVEGLGNSCVSVSTHNGLDNMDRGLRHFGVLFDGNCVFVHQPADFHIILITSCLFKLQELFYRLSNRTARSGVPRYARRLPIVRSIKFRVPLYGIAAQFVVVDCVAQISP